MDPGHKYSRQELEVYAAARGLSVASGPRLTRLIERYQPPADEVEEAREAYQALRYAAASPGEVSAEVTKAIARRLKDALQDAGKRAVPWVNWKAAWDLWACVMSGGVSSDS